MPKPTDMEDLYFLLDVGLFVCKHAENLSNIMYVIDVDLHNAIWSLGEWSWRGDASTIKNEILVGFSTTK